MPKTVGADYSYAVVRRKHIAYRGEELMHCNFEPFCFQEGFSYFIEKFYNPLTPIGKEPAGITCGSYKSIRR